MSKNENTFLTAANFVTITRICLIPLFVVALLSPWPNWLNLNDVITDHTKAIIATIVFIVISTTDWLDGYLARSRSEVTTFGKFMDPLADKILVIAALLAMVELKVLPSWPVIIIIAREFVVSGVRMLAANQNIVIAASWYGKAKTLTQIIAIVLFLSKEGLSLNSPLSAISNPLYVSAWAVMILSLILTIISMIDYIKKYSSSLSKIKNEQAKSQLQKKIYNSSKELLDILDKNDFKFVTAESLTGGMISTAITSIPGSSSCFLGGFCTYAFELKRDALDVDHSFLQDNGAVNDKTAISMAKGALKHSIADIAVSVTGIAGPGGQEKDKPVGTVYMCIASKFCNEIFVSRFNFEGDRCEVRSKTTLQALQSTIEYIQKFH